MFPRLTSINIKGYKCFRDFTAHVEPLEVFVGANGSGKTSLFEFLGFLRDGARDVIPPEVIKGSAGQEVFRIGGSSFSWELRQSSNDNELTYKGALIGPKGGVISDREEIQFFVPRWNLRETIFESDSKQYIMRPRGIQKPALDAPQEFQKDKHNTRALGLYYMNRKEYEEYRELYSFSEHVKNYGLFSSFRINRDKIRRTILLQQDMALDEDLGNLSSILFSLSNDHGELFNDLKRNLKLVVPGFEDIKVRQLGGPGEVIAFWWEKGGDKLTLADLSDGILNLLCWFTLCLIPDPHSLVCIDEPELGVHPRALPLLAGLFQKLSERTQVFIATHSSYLLAQFPVENIIVMKKEGGEVVARKVKDSKTLVASLEEFGQEELEAMHQSDELEALS